jgi:hypothetical protein
LLQSYGRILAMASSDPPAGGDREVLSGLPNSRPTRRSAKRDGAGGQRAPRAAGEAPAKPQRSGARGAAKPRAAKPRAAAKGSAAGEAAGAPRANAPRRPALKAAPIPPAGYATPRTDDDGPRGADLVTTAVQAAGEIAHIAIATGGRALKSALQRLPRP